MLTPELRTPKHSQSNQEPFTVGASIIAYTALGAPGYTCSIIYIPQNPILIIEAPIVYYPYRSLKVALIDRVKGTPFISLRLRYYAGVDFPRVFWLRAFKVAKTLY